MALGNLGIYVQQQKQKYLKREKNFNFISKIKTKQNATYFAPLEKIDKAL
jgi:hypothetical protein